MVIRLVLRTIFWNVRFGASLSIGVLRNRGPVKMIRTMLLQMCDDDDDDDVDNDRYYGFHSDQRGTFINYLALINVK